MDENQLIDDLGGTVELARICDTTPQAVSQWRTNGIPDARRQYLALKFPALVTYEPKRQVTTDRTVA